ncbi:MAG: restriction endonuclease subunit S [Lachnospiraceae bacterium]|nr:restriction endonuclease subunit S [Lachnospiraceae bacterium]
MRLSDICEVYSGYALKSFSDSEEGLPVVKIGNILADGTLNLTKCQYTSEVVNEKYFSNYGDIYIALSGATTGKIGIMNTDKKYIINQRVGIVRKKMDNIPQGYIKYFLLHQTDRILQEAAGCAQPNISPKQIAEYLVPEIHEEKMMYVCDTLDKTKCVIDLQKQQLEQLDLLIKARFVEIFGDPVSNPKGWNRISLDDCIESIDNGKSFICDANARTDDKPAILKLSSVTYGVYRPNENKAIIDENDFVETAEVQNGDLLFTRKNTPELVGMSAYVEKTPRKLMMPDLIFRLNTKDNCNKVYLWKLINHELFRGQIQSIANGSAKSMSNISKERLLGLSICLPPLELQNEFADFVTQVDKSKFDTEMLNLMVHTSNLIINLEKIKGKILVISGTNDMIK